MKRKLFYLIFALALIIISFFSIKSFAKEDGIKIEEFNYISSQDLQKEAVSEISSKEQLKLKNGFSLNDKIYSDKANGVKYKQKIQNGNVYKYDIKNNELLEYREDYTKLTPKPINEKEAKEKISKKYIENKLPAEYKMSYIEYDEDDYLWEAKYEKEIDGVKNQYQGIKLKYSPSEDRIVFFRKFNQKPLTRSGKIDKEFIRRNEKTYINLIKSRINNKNEFKLKVDEAKLTYKKPNSWFSYKAKELAEAEEVLRAWDVECTNGIHVYIDESTGNIIAGDSFKYAEALSSNSTLSKISAPAHQSVPAMHWAFEKLKYRTFSRLDDATTYILKDWIYRGGPQYGFYISTHGGFSNNEAYFFDSDDKSWHPSDIKGNWDFVFIDACHSKDNESLASAFKIYSGSSKKAYLGWKNTVEVWPAEKFVKAFTNRVGDAPIQRIAKEVAEGMPEDVPIRFTGDKGWYGYAR